MNGIWRNALCTAPDPSNSRSRCRAVRRPVSAMSTCGIGAVADERVRVLHHLGGRVRVKVERCDDGNVRADERAYPAQQLTLAVLEVLGHHRPVQAEVHRVEGTRGPQPVQNEPRDVLPGMLGDVGGRRGGPPGRGQQVVPRALRLVDEPRDGEVHAPHPVRKPGSGGQLRPFVGGLELGERRERGCEGVGLVLKAADRDARHRSCSLRCEGQIAPIPGCGHESAKCAVRGLSSIRRPARTSRGRLTPRGAAPAAPRTRRHIRCRC